LKPRIPVLLLVLAALPFLFSCGGTVSSPATVPPPTTNQSPPMLALSSFVSGLVSPVGFEAPSDGTNRIFILQQGGAIRIIQNGSLMATPFLDVSAKTGFVSGGETGLLGLAFHPAFRANGKFYVYYTRRISGQLQSVLTEYSASPPDSNVASVSSERILLVVNQPFDNHNGGQLAFGPDDGDLYFALGDGGSAGDPQGNGQNTAVLLGKILRLDVTSTPPAGRQYAIPLDNPFANSGGAPEIFAYGLRNPWRFSFDSATHRLIAGDVGQDNWEEVDIIANGKNYGWNRTEGNHCYPPSVTTCNMAGMTPPITEYDHSSTGGTSVIGGFVYRGSAIPALVGTYVFGDLSSGNVWGLKEDGSGNWQRTLLLTHTRTVSSFGRDTAGELYMVDYGNGAVLHITAAP
jgi:glucose/arabinose dehydrogenase